MDEALERALALMDLTPMLDGHNDLAWVIRIDPDARGSVERYDLTRRHETGDTDIPRLREGKVGAQVWPAFVPTDIKDPATATQEQIDLIRRFHELHPDVFLPVSTADDIEKAHRQGKIASILAVEGGVGLENSLASLPRWYADGVRLMTLCHNGSLDWVDSATDKPRSGGLSAFGRAVIGELNRLGIVVDCSHVSPEAAHQVLDITTAPVAFSHSNAQTLCGSPRNAPDDLLHRVRGNDGIVMATFIPDFTNEKTRRWMRAVRPLIAGKFGRERVDIIAEHAKSVGPCPEASLEDVADHIEYLAASIGPTRVGIGSDFYGVPVMPRGLQDVTCYPFLLAELFRRGWVEDDVANVAGRNFVRVMRAVQRCSDAAK